jgi:hypothetical protein
MISSSGRTLFLQDDSTRNVYQLSCKEGEDILECEILFIIYAVMRRISKRIIVIVTGLLIHSCHQHFRFQMIDHVESLYLIHICLTTY